MRRPEVFAGLGERGISYARVGHHARALLGPHEASKAYRDGSEPVLDPALEPLLAPVSTHLGLRTRAATELDVFDRLLALPELAAADIRFDEQPLRRLIDAATDVMRQLRFHSVIIEHVLIALTTGQADDGRFARALTLLGHEQGEVKRALKARAREPRLRSTTGLASIAVLRTLAAQRANLTARHDLDVATVVVEVLRNSYSRAALKAAGVSQAELLFAYVHGVVPMVTSAVAGAGEVALFDDDFTKMDVVTAILERHFGKSAEEAAALMRAVHEAGTAAFAVGDFAAAAKAILAARAECAELGMPLRMELRALPAAAPPPAVHNR